MIMQRSARRVKVNEAKVKSLWYFMLLIIANQTGFAAEAVMCHRGRCCLTYGVTEFLWGNLGMWFMFVFWFFLALLQRSVGSVKLFIFVHTHSQFLKSIKQATLLCSVTLPQRDTYSAQETYSNITHTEHRRTAPANHKQGASNAFLMLSDVCMWIFWRGKGWLSNGSYFRMCLLPLAAVIVLKQESWETNTRGPLYTA